MDQFIPNWNYDTRVPEIGKNYIWQIVITGCNFNTPPDKKPFMLLDAEVEGGDWDKFKFEFKVYISPRAKKIATWFLKKFSYSEEMLKLQPPVLKSELIVGLRGKVLIAVEDDHGGLLDFRANGFSRFEEDDLEVRLEKKKESLQVFDLEADLEEEDPFKGLV